MTASNATSESSDDSAAPTTGTHALSQEGVSIWLDDLSRGHLTSGYLAELIKTRNVVGVTTNPTIFAAALTDGDAYRDQVALLSRAKRQPRRGHVRPDHP